MEIFSFISKTKFHSYTRPCSHSRKYNRQRNKFNNTSNGKDFTDVWFIFHRQVLNAFVRVVNVFQYDMKADLMTSPLW